VAHLRTDKSLSRILHLFTVLVFGVAISTAPVRAADDFSWHSIADAIALKLNEAVVAHRADDAKGAKRALTRAYFGVFESQKMEAALRKTMGQTHAFKVERMFTGLRSQIGNQSHDAFADAVQDLVAQLHDDADKLDTAGIPKEVYDAQ